MDRSAFERQARTWREKAISVSMSYGAGKDEAEDIAQDVMLRLWQMHDELDRYESVEALAALVAKHLLTNHQRRRQSVRLDLKSSRPNMSICNAEKRKSRIENPDIQCGRISNPTELRGDKSDRARYFFRVKLQT